MAALTMELLERRLAEHREWQERMLISESLPGDKSSFEEFAENLGLSADGWERSRQLREWARRNKDFCYVPEKLLNAWGMTVNLEARERLQ